MSKWLLTANLLDHVDFIVVVVELHQSEIPRKRRDNACEWCFALLRRIPWAHRQCLEFSTESSHWQTLYRRGRSQAQALFAHLCIEREIRQHAKTWFSAVWLFWYIVCMHDIFCTFHQINVLVAILLVAYGVVKDMFMVALSCNVLKTSYMTGAVISWTFKSFSAIECSLAQALFAYIMQRLIWWPAHVSAATHWQRRSSSRVPLPPKAFNSLVFFMPTNNPHVSRPGVTRFPEFTVLGHTRQLVFGLAVNEHRLHSVQVMTSCERALVDYFDHFIVVVELQ